MDGMSDAIRHEVTERVTGETFMRLGVSQRYGGEVVKRSARRILLRGEVMYQMEETRNGKTRAENLTLVAMRAELEKMLEAPGAWELHVMTGEGDVHVRRTRKGHVMVSRSKAVKRELGPLEGHDRKKGHLLEQFDSRDVLRVVGIAGADGAVRASMRGKYDQVNAFLREVEAVTQDAARGTAFTLVDAGCGLAYLTFAAHGYLSRARGLKVRAIGVDRKEDVVARARAMAEELGVADEVEFVCADLETMQLDARPDLVMSLHACDTATDEALARAVEWGSKRVLCAPCCQHELHASLKHDGAMRGMMRHGILRERLGDLLTDAFRAQILRVLGYRVKVVEFVAQEATARNVMLRAEAGLRPGVTEAVEEYVALRDFWHVTPWLEQRLATRLAEFLEGAP